MANNKNQHFVPKCHLKPFSDSEGKASINLYNIKRSSFVKGASIKGQCARNYLYGDDRLLEGIFQDFEGKYATVVRSISDGILLSESDLFFLMQFMHLQYYRTVMAVQRMDDSIDTLRDEIYRDTDNKPDEDKPDEKQRTILSLRFCFSSMHLIEDLKICIIVNNTNLDLVTSDDPVIFTKKFSFQKLNDSSFGLANSGLMYVMPLSPRAAVIAYDGGVYSIEGKTGYRITLKNRSDVEALNELQYLKSHENIYFCNWANREEIRYGFNSSKANRLNKGPRSRTMIRDHTVSNSELYKVGTDEERAKSRENLVTITYRYPRPSRWISAIKYRNPPKAYDTGTAMGVVRIKDPSVLKEKLDRYRNSGRKR